MKITDIVVDWLNDTPLFEMAHQRKRAIEIVTNYQHQIASHIVKCLYYDVSPETKKHWMAEINAWLGKINAIKLKNGKKLSGDVYYNILFDEPLGEITDVEGIVESIDTFEGMDTFDKIGNIHTMHEQCEKILHTLSYDFSNGNAKSIQHYFEMYN